MSGENAADVFGDGDFDDAGYAAIDGGRPQLEPAPDPAAGYRARFGA